jgi:putative membrane-bound dehydrogenase-like protein
MLKFRIIATLVVGIGFLFITTDFAQNPDKKPLDFPKVLDPELEIHLFATSPDIVHPVGITFDAKGRLLVIESHTHFRPQNYKGPPADRIRMMEDTDGDGKADRFTTFFEGTQATMDIATHPDGSIYIATRNEIIRLRDTNNDGKADENQRIVFLDTKGNYPHNGISGISFDSKGDMFFGLGENLGADFKLIGSDKKVIAGEGQGGDIFWCTADGKNLKHICTGFWNPFGTCQDIYGRMFAVDNDPDSMPPCRMVHAVEGGDYGYQFRYGRAGRHPFQAWNGELLGTLPQLIGTGEAPCEILSYESDGLPKQYLGHLLVASWADHRIERYPLKARGASFGSEMKTLVQGGKDFRPVGLAVAPDGSLFISDWVLRDYNLHNKGAIWHVRRKNSPTPDRPQDPKKALLSLHRPLRESAAKKLAETEEGRTFLREQLLSEEPRVRVASLVALRDAKDAKIDLVSLAEKDPDLGIQMVALQALVTNQKEVHSFLDGKVPPELRRIAIGGLNQKSDLPQLLEFLNDSDPFLRQAAVHQLSKNDSLVKSITLDSLKTERQRVGLVLAHRASGQKESTSLIEEFLKAKDPEVRFFAAKWIADEKLSTFRPQLLEALKDPGLNIRTYTAYSTALARIDNRPANEAQMIDYFFARLNDEKSPPGIRVMALQLIPSNHPKLKLDFFVPLLSHSDPKLQLEAVRALSEHPDSKRFPILLKLAQDTQLGPSVRAQAILGLSERSQQYLNDLFGFAISKEETLRHEALRALVQTKLTDNQKKALASVTKQYPDSEDLIARVLGKPFAKNRPPIEDTIKWLKLLEGEYDLDAGHRIFFSSKMGTCSRCHKVEARGRNVGPDLSVIGRTEKRHILESILQPSLIIAPHYQAWQMEFLDGKVRSGILNHTDLDDYIYIDEKGEPFKVNTRNVAETKPLKTSIMPTGLADQLTDQELRDLLAYLASRR